MHVQKALLEWLYGQNPAKIDRGAMAESQYVLMM